MAIPDNNLERRTLDFLARRLPPGWSIQESSVRPKDRSFRPDLIAEVRGPGGERGLIIVETKTRLEPVDVALVAEQLGRYPRALGKEAVPMLAAPFLSPRTRQRLDAAGIGYADLTGNARLAVSRPALYIETHGAEENPNPEERPARSLRGGKAGRIVRALCDWGPPHRVRSLAERVGVDAGYASRILAFLAAEDFLKRERRGVVVQVRWRELIERWAQDYSFTESNRVRTYLEPRDIGTLAARLAALEVRYAVTGTLAASTVAPVAPARMVAAYVADAESVAQRLDLRPAESGANVLLAEPFDDVVFARTREADGIVHVSLSQAAADLLSGPGRGPSEAQALLDWMQAHESDWRS